MTHAQPTYTSQPTCIVVRPSDIKTKTRPENEAKIPHAHVLTTDTVLEVSMEFRSPKAYPERSEGTTSD